MDPNAPKKLQAIDEKFLSITHIVPFENKYSPYVPFASEYYNVDQTGGLNNGSGRVTFSLPVFGDFLSDMFFHANYTETYCNPGVLPNLPTNINPVDGTGSVPLDLPDIVLPDGSSVPVAFADQITNEYYFHKVTYRYLDTMTGKFLEPDNKDE